MSELSLSVPADLVPLAEAHYHFLSLWPGYVRKEHAGASLIGNQLLPIPFRNHVALVRSQAEDVDGLIEKANHFYDALTAAPAFQLDPATTPVDLPERLLNTGYEKRVEEIWMLCTLAETPVVSVPTHIAIEQITLTSSESLIQAYVDCFNVSFRVPERVHVGFGLSFRGILPNPTGLHFVALLDGEPAGALTLLHEGGLGGVYNVGTFPHFRGRGVASALLLHLVAVARQIGLERLLLQTVHHGPAQPIYEKTGFRPHFVRDWYLPQAPGGIWSK